MLYTIFTVGGMDYKLRLNTRNTINLEKQLGCNPLAIFGDGDTFPTVTTMVHILYASLQQLNHGISLNDAFDLFDDWLDEGHVVTDFLNIIVEIYKVSGLIQKEKEAEKN